MKWIKTIWYFLITFIGICMICFFGLVGVCAAKDIFSYLWVHCSDLMWFVVGFLISVIGAVIGWGVFSDGLNKLKDS
jgi:uncharacterized membrane protein YeaQ/YmgE (transglycosylase-associated protein family)